MPLIQWNAGLSVQVPEMDAQHQKLFALINALNDAMLSGKSKETLGAILAELAKYTTVHFAHEERCLKQVGYPALADQVAEHRTFQKEVQRFQGEFAAGRIGLSIDIMSFLNDWLKKHILGKDKQYSPYLAAKSTAPAR
jgi:hemerythrin